MRGISWLAEDLLASEEGLYSMELVSVRWVLLLRLKKWPLVFRMHSSATSADYYGTLCCARTNSVFEIWILLHGLQGQYNSVTQSFLIFSPTLLLPDRCTSYVVKRTRFKIIVALEIGFQYLAISVFPCFERRPLSCLCKMRGYLNVFVILKQRTVSNFCV